MQSNLNAVLADYVKAYQQSQQRIHADKPLSPKQTLAALAENLSDEEASDQYGNGPLMTNFETQVAQLLGKEAALFLTSGTLAQPMALKIWAEQARTPYVAMHATSHLQLHEFNGYQIVHGLKGVTLGQAHHVPQLADLKKAATDPLAAILLELPMREIGGQLPPWDELVAQSQWAKKQGIKLHLDGARLWQCPAAYGKPLSDIAGLFDSVYVSFYKDLGGISGAVLAGDKQFIDTAKIWQRRLGGNLYALYPYVVAARMGLENTLPKMPARLDQALWLAEQLNQFEGCTTWPCIPHTNMFRVRLYGNPEVLLARATEWMRQTGDAILPNPWSIHDDHILYEITVAKEMDSHERLVWQTKIESFFAAIHKG